MSLCSSWITDSAIPLPAQCQGYLRFLHPHHQRNKPLMCSGTGIHISQPGESSRQVSPRSIAFWAHPARKRLRFPAKPHNTPNISPRKASPIAAQTQVIHMHRPAASSFPKTHLAPARSSAEAGDNSQSLSLYRNDKRCLTFLRWSVSQTEGGFAIKMNTHAENNFKVARLTNWQPSVSLIKENKTQ